MPCTRRIGRDGRPDDDTLVFPGTGKEGYLNAFALGRGVLYPAMERAGIDRVAPTGEKRTFHSFRHTYARCALQSGADIFWLQRQMGHSSYQGHDRHLRPLGAEGEQAGGREGAVPGTRCAYTRAYRPVPNDPHERQRTWYGRGPPSRCSPRNHDSARHTPTGPPGLLIRGSEVRILPGALRTPHTRGFLVTSSGTDTWRGECRARHAWKKCARVTNSPRKDSGPPPQPSEEARRASREVLPG
jgi:hypothetical protein